MYEYDKGPCVPKKYTRKVYIMFQRNSEESFTMVSKISILEGFTGSNDVYPWDYVSKDYRRRTYMFKRSIQDGSIGFKDVYQRGFCRFEKSIH